LLLFYFIYDALTIT